MEAPSATFDSSHAMQLVGIDVGTTTTSLMVAAARLLRNCVTGRHEFGDVQPVFRPEPVFTPFSGEALDIAGLEKQLDHWLAEARLEPADIASGGALVTGLAARSANAAAVKELVRSRFPRALVAATDDPCLESWLAFMGNALGPSRAEPARPFINVDIGGGTANIAWGLAGEVRRCGCYFVGARHIQVEPGSYRVRSLSPFGRALLAELGIPADLGHELSVPELKRVLEFYVELLEATVAGRAQGISSETGKDRLALEQLHCQTEFVPPESNGIAPVVTLSGGVGELAYRCVRGEVLPGTTAFGDLGIDLAERICQSSVLGRDLKSHVPPGLGRATVQGLTIHSSEISGATIYLPDPGILPLCDLPIVGTFDAATSDADLKLMIDLARRAAEGACLSLAMESTDAPTVKRLGERLASLLNEAAVSPTRPLVLLISENVGKTLGQYATGWGRRPAPLIVIDEIPRRPAQFATIGQLQLGLIPVSFHGLAAQM